MDYDKPLDFKESFPSGEKQGVVILTTEKIAGSNINHANGAIAEAHGYDIAIKNGEIGIQAPGKVTASGPDYITYNPENGKITVWDSKYSSKEKWPNSAKGFESEKWKKEVENAINNVSDKNMKKTLQKALKEGKIDWKIFKWPPQ